MNPFLLLVAAGDPRRARTRICGGCRFVACSIFLLLVILIFAIISAVFLVLNSFLYAELCPYISTEAGIKQTDYVVNTFLADAMSNVSSMANGMVQIPPPKNVLYGIGIECKPTKEDENPYLLPKIGINHFVDLDSLVTPEQIEKMVNDVSK